MYPPDRKISAHEFERGGLLKPIVNTIDGTPTFLSVGSQNDSAMGSMAGPSTLSYPHRPQRLSRNELKHLDEKQLIFELVRYRICCLCQAVSVLFQSHPHCLIHSTPLQSTFPYILDPQLQVLSNFMISLCFWISFFFFVCLLFARCVAASVSFTTLFPFCSVCHFPILFLFFFSFFCYYHFYCHILILFPYWISSIPYIQIHLILWLHIISFVLSFFWTFFPSST